MLLDSLNCTGRRVLSCALLLPLFLALAWLAARAQSNQNAPSSDPPFRTDFSASRPINLATGAEVRPDPPFRTDFSASRTINPLATGAEIKPDPPFRTDFSASRPLSPLRH
jgi:hypothetical protein